MAETQSSRLVRLNKFIADSGFASRRKADELIANGDVHVNGKRVYELGVRVDPIRDKVTVKGKPLFSSTAKKVYIMFNKPRAILTSMSDPDGRPTVADFFNKLPHRVFPVGRLDWDTEGLLLLTNDGQFAQEVMHPRKEIPKTYMAKLNGQPTEEHLKRLLKGVTIVGGKAKALYVERIRRGSDKYDWIQIIITEGRNRQIRQMFAKIGFDVKKLKRVAIGQLRLGSLRSGEFIFLNSSQLRRIFTPRKERERQKSTKTYKR